MSAVRACPPAHTRAFELRRVILSDAAGGLLGEVSLGPGVCPRRVSTRHATAQVLTAACANGSDRPPTGDALHVVIGRRACFGYAVDVDRVCWFSHPRLARADAFSARDDREVRRVLYDLHADDPDIVSEIIWETSGRIRVHRAPALPAGIDPRTGPSRRRRDNADYWSAIVQVVSAAGFRGPGEGCLSRPKRWVGMRSWSPHVLN